MIEARPFEEYKEMIKDMRKEEMIRGLYDLSSRIIELDKEFVRLNNIINKMNDYLIMNMADGSLDFMYRQGFKDSYDRLIELKGSDK